MNFKIPQIDKIKQRFSQAPFNQQAAFLGLAAEAQLDDCLRADYVQTWVKKYAASQSVLPHFVDQNSLSEEAFDYESYIAQTNTVPTRANSWHDLFNAYIWGQFTQSKRYLNTLHYSQISLHGVHPRSKIRNNITLFDECGVVLFTDQSWLKDALRQHDWHRLFIDYRAHWHKQIKVVIFGHAMWEMMLAPFIGLTAKALVIELDSNILTQCVNENADQWIHDHLSTEQTLFNMKPFSPLPILGVPGWYAPQNRDFYDNQAYFMPKPEVKVR